MCSAAAETSGWSLHTPALCSLMRSPRFRAVSSTYVRSQSLQVNSYTTPDFKDGSVAWKCSRSGMRVFFFVVVETALREAKTLRKNPVYNIKFYRPTIEHRILQVHLLSSSFSNRTRCELVWQELTKSPVSVHEPSVKSQVFDMYTKVLTQFSADI